MRDHHASELAQRYLDVGAREITIAPQLLRAVRFETVNLLDERACATLGQFDVVLCRNVLIYFRDTRVEQVVTRLVSALRPDGLLAVGVAESLLRFPARVTCIERRGAFFYRRGP